MNVMRGHPTLWTSDPGHTSITIGVLDGVHRGHRSLIRRLDPTSVRTALIFDPHPVEILRPGTHPRLLTTLEERLLLLNEAGIDQVGVLDLSDIKEFEPARFVEEVLIERLSVRQIVCGPDFRFGKDRAGDVYLLSDLGQQHDFVVDRAPLVVDDAEEPVSSSAIRRMIETGHPDRAAEAMGSPFRLTGTVERGDARGRELGVPTANIELPERKVTPALGVYAGYVRWNDHRYKAAINIGVRPTFGEGRPLVEAHILDFDQDLYGERIVVELAHYLRAELKFDNIDDLIKRMHTDIADTRSLLR